MRGTVVIRTPKQFVVRITPACAGNRRRGYIHQSASPAEDHPRVCGEQRIRQFKRALCRGSPPRVRGTVQIFIPRGAYEAITPACAGNSINCRSNSARKQDHPRVCGEQLMKERTRLYQAGSPPRVRGTGQPSEVLSPRMGITPACAGNRSTRAARTRL